MSTLSTTLGAGMNDLAECDAQQIRRSIEPIHRCCRILVRPSSEETA
jgi:hypothetical protein